MRRLFVAALVLLALVALAARPSSEPQISLQTLGTCDDGQSIAVSTSSACLGAGASSSGTALVPGGMYETTCNITVHRNWISQGDSTTAGATTKPFLAVLTMKQDLLKDFNQNADGGQAGVCFITDTGTGTCTVCRKQ